MQLQTVQDQKQDLEEFLKYTERQSEVKKDHWKGQLKAKEDYWKKKEDEWKMKEKELNKDLKDLKKDVENKLKWKEDEVKDMKTRFLESQQKLTSSREKYADCMKALMKINCLAESNKSTLENQSVMSYSYEAYQQPYVPHPQTFESVMAMDQYSQGNEAIYKHADGSYETYQHAVGSSQHPAGHQSVVSTQMDFTQSIIVALDAVIPKPKA
uniref:Uncharacterized protein n=1 Tax=Acrobeloides nanus TaxID=290746 RepID=A0A914CIQ6_9BILA